MEPSDTSGTSIVAIRDRIDEIDAAIVDLLAERYARSMEIGRIKAEAGIPLHAPLREHSVIDSVEQRAAAAGIGGTPIRLLYRLVIEHSRAAQRRAAEASVPGAASAS
jgi:chorismate mutase/prephenate dehydrogenase